MTYATLTPTQATILRQARSLSADERKAIKREVFDMSRARYGIPASDRLKAEIDNADAPHFMQVRNADNNSSYLLDDATGRVSENGTTAPARVFRVFSVSHADLCGDVLQDIEDGDIDLEDGDDATADTPYLEAYGGGVRVRVDVTDI